MRNLRGLLEIVCFHILFYFQAKKLQLVKQNFICNLLIKVRVNLIDMIIKPTESKNNVWIFIYMKQS